MGSEQPHPPADLLELVLAVFQAVLDNEDVDADTDFFEAGGNSILAARAVTRVQKQSGAEVSFRDLLFARTAKELAAKIEDKGPRGSRAV